MLLLATSASASFTRGISDHNRPRLSFAHFHPLRTQLPAPRSKRNNRVIYRSLSLAGCGIPLPVCIN